LNRVCIHQPDFLPYLGFFHRLLFTDIFIILDDVQFIRRGWHHRDKIKTRDGVKWLTVPICKGDYYQKINQVLLDKNKHKWIRNHLNLLKANYRNAHDFDKYFLRIKELYLLNHTKLIDLNMSFLHFFLELFDINIKIMYSSQLNVEGNRNLKLISLLKAVGACHYLSGLGAKAYLKEDLFFKEGITVEWQNFDHPVYHQLHGEFMPNLSCIDILFNCGAYAKEILWSTQKRK